MAFGISLSDIGYVVLALMGLASLLEESSVRFWMGLAGALVLIGYGVYNWFKHTKVTTESKDTENDFTYLKYLLKGLILNGFNPFIIVFWVGLIGVVAVNYEYGPGEQGYFFAGVLTTILTTDLTKAYIANRVRNLITPTFILRMNRIIGVILIVFGLRLIYFLFENYWGV